MRLPGRFDAQRHVMFQACGDAAATRRRRRHEPLQFTEWEIGQKNEVHLKCSIKMTSHRSTGYEEIIPDVRGFSLVVCSGAKKIKNLFSAKRNSQSHFRKDTIMCLLFCSVLKLVLSG